MIDNLSSYFRPEHQFYLHSINFKKIEDNQQLPADTKNIELSCSDNLTVNTDPNYDVVNLFVTRTLSFKPDILFHASVTFGAILKFNDRKHEIDWKSVDLSNEFLYNGQFVTSNLMARITLLMGEITSSTGQTPLFLPPQIIVPDKNSRA